ncbi:MAG: hypothetical protein ACKVZJ_11325 [Phycisphaerales bacterium]
MTPLRAIFFAAGVLLAPLTWTRAQSTPTAAPTAPAAPTPSPATLSGVIAVPAGRAMPELVVYLERPAAAADAVDPAPAPEPPASPAAPATPPPASASPDAPSPTSPKSPGTSVITQKDAKFIPSFLVIPVGAAVEFRNDEPTDLEHNVFSRSDPRTFDLGMNGPKDPPRTVTFDKPGEVSLYCSVHRYMDATIYVAPTAHFATPDKEGRFEITGVPPGEWVLRTWQRRKRLNDAALDITLTPGETRKLRVELTR